MGISENFLVNTKTFDPIIKALISLPEQPEIVSESTLEKMGYENPSDLLVLHVLKGMDILDHEKKPTELYYKMADPELTQEAIAEGVINGYKELFEQNYNVHKLLPGELQDELKEYFDGKKTDLIIKYIANTFHKLVSYAGIEQVEAARNRMLEEKEQILAETETEGESGNNGSTKPDFQAAADQSEIKSRSVEEILFGDKGPEEETEDKKSEESEDVEEASSEERETDRSEMDVVEAKAEAEVEVEAEMEKDTETEATGSEEIDEDIDKEEPMTSSTRGKKESETGARLDLSRLDTADKRIQKALVKRSELQYRLKYYEEALDSSEEIINYFEEAGEEFLQRAVAEAVIRRAELVSNLGQEHKLLPALNEVIRRFSNSDNQAYYEQASRAMLQKAELLEQQEFDQQDLLPLYHTIVERLKGNDEPAIQEKVNEIFIKRLQLLNKAGKKSDLLGALEESIERFEGSGEFRKYLEEAMFRKAELLEEMNRYEQALDAYTTFLEEFGQTIET